MIGVPDLITRYVDVTFDGTDKQMVTGVFQYDHGLMLRVHGLPTDVVWQFQYGYRSGTETITSVGEAEDDAVVSAIPDTLLMQQREVICYIYYESETYGMTIYQVFIPLIPRLKPAAGTYTPEQIDTFNTLLAQLNALIEEADGLNEQSETINAD